MEQQNVLIMNQNKLCFIKYNKWTPTERKTAAARLFYWLSLDCCRSKVLLLHRGLTPNFKVVSEKICRQNKLNTERHAWCNHLHRGRCLLEFTCFHIGRLQGVRNSKTLEYFGPILWLNVFLFVLFVSNNDRHERTLLSRMIFHSERTGWGQNLSIDLFPWSILIWSFIMIICVNVKINLYLVTGWGFLQTKTGVKQFESYKSKTVFSQGEKEKAKSGRIVHESWPTVIRLRRDRRLSTTPLNGCSHCVHKVQRNTSDTVSWVLLTTITPYINFQLDCMFTEMFRQVQNWLTQIPLLPSWTQSREVTFSNYQDLLCSDVGGGSSCCCYKYPPFKLIKSTMFITCNVQLAMEIIMQHNDTWSQDSKVTGKLNPLVVHFVPLVVAAVMHGCPDDTTSLVINWQNKVTPRGHRGLHNQSKTHSVKLVASNTSGPECL